MPDLHKALGAGPPAGALQITVFIPSVDWVGVVIGNEYYGITEYDNQEVKGAKAR